MKITTLEYIHTLLKTQEAKTCVAYKEARRLQHEYEEHAEDSMDDKTRKGAKELAKNNEFEAERLMAVHLEAKGALKDFESQEW